MTVITKKQRDEVIKQMPESLRKKLESLQKLVNDQERNNLKARYEFGKVVAEIASDKDKYGNAGLDQTAIYCNMAIRNLHYFIAVQAMFNPEDIKEISERVDVNGYRFTWTHLRLLTQVDRAPDRNKLIKVWEKEGLDNREFEKRVKALLAASAPDNGTDGDNAPRKATESSVKALIKQVTSMEERMNEVEQLDLLPFAGDAGKRELLSQLTTRLETIRSEAKTLEERIAEILANNNEPFDPDVESGEDDDTSGVDVDSLLADDDDVDASDAARGVLNRHLSAPPTKNTGSRRKGKTTKAPPKGKPTKSSAKAATKAAPAGKKTGPSARRRRGEAVTA